MPAAESRGEAGVGRGRSAASAGGRRCCHGQPDALLVAVAHRVVGTERVVLATTGIVVVMAAGGRALTQTPAVEKGKVALAPKRQRHHQRHQRAGGEAAVPVAAVAEAGPVDVGEAHAQVRRQRKLIGDVAEGEEEVPQRATDSGGQGDPRSPRRAPRARAAASAAQPASAPAPALQPRWRWRRWGRRRWLWWRRWWR